MTAAKEELAYVLINPYTVYKSRTGGVISRLFTRTALELVAARMFAPGRELVQRYAEIAVSPKDPRTARSRNSSANTSSTIIRQTRKADSGNA